MQTREHRPPTRPAVSGVVTVCGLWSRGGDRWSGPAGVFAKGANGEAEVAGEEGPGLSPGPACCVSVGSLCLLLAAQATAPSATKRLPRPAPPHPPRDGDKGASARLIVSLLGDSAQNACPASS